MIKKRIIKSKINKENKIENENIIIKKNSNNFNIIENKKITFENDFENNLKPKNELLIKIENVLNNKISNHNKEIIELHNKDILLKEINKDYDKNINCFKIENESLNNKLILEYQNSLENLYQKIESLYFTNLNNIINNKEINFELNSLLEEFLLIKKYFENKNNNKFEIINNYLIFLDHNYTCFYLKQDNYFKNLYLLNPLFSNKLLKFSTELMNKWRKTIDSNQFNINYKKDIKLLEEQKILKFL